MVGFFAAIASPADAENGMGKGYGPCWDIATPAERALMKNESRGWPSADNPNSSAFGCGQLLSGNRRLYAEQCNTSPVTLDANDSMCLMRAYIADRYGSAGRALSFRQRNGWY